SRPALVRRHGSPYGAHRHPHPGRAVGTVSCGTEPITSSIPPRVQTCLISVGRCCRQDTVPSIFKAHVPAIRSAKALLLTGAGFSKPFGGYLSSEMWAVIFRQPEIRNLPHIRKQMLEELNFETLYEEVQDSSTYTAEEKSAVTEAVLRSYQQMHEDMGDRRQFGSFGANAVCQQFLSKFASADPGGRGFIFTLNQDLLVEAFGSLPIYMPGLPAGRTLAQPVSLPGSDAVSAEAAAFSFTKRSSLTYIKLHGSFEWRGANESRAIVIGTNKGKMLSNEPLLKWYQEIFWQVLHEQQRSLLVIGYSFRDPHINEVILSAVRSRGLKLFVMSPAIPEEFRARLHGVVGTGADYIERGDQLWQALHGYYRGSVTDFYMTDHVKLPRIGTRLFEDLGLL